jgi:putative heme-binding domain-containing protein
VVDFYRFVVEHPRWITPDRLKALDLRAGDDKGRIYRVYPEGKVPRRVPDLARLGAVELAEALRTPNGTERDRVHLELSRRREPHAVEPLLRLFRTNTLPAVRVQALAALDALQRLTAGLVVEALEDPHPEIRRFGLRQAERWLGQEKQVQEAALRLVADPEPSVRYQLALSLGQWQDVRAGAALGELARIGFNDLWQRAAILSSAAGKADAILSVLLSASERGEDWDLMVRDLIATASGSSGDATLSKILLALAPTDPASAPVWQLKALASLLEALQRKELSLERISEQIKNSGAGSIKQIRACMAGASKRAEDVSAAASVRLAWIGLMGRDSALLDQDSSSLCRLVVSDPSEQIRTAALQTLGRCRGPKVGELLLRGWKNHSPRLRAAILGTILQREEWSEQVISAVRQGEIARGDLSTANWQRLLKHSNAALREAASALWEQNASRNRAQVLDQFKAALQLPGDQRKGGELFAKSCATCHAFRGQGAAVGPNLAALTDKSGGFLLTSIVDPNAALEDRFVSYILTTRDGRELSGLVTGETATSLTLVTSGGAKDTVLRSDLSEIRASNLSFMPEGLEQGLTLQDMANLIAYVQRPPKPFGTAGVDQMTAAQKEFLEARPNGLRRILQAAEESTYPSWLGIQPLSLCRQTDGQSKLIWETEPADKTPTSTGYRTFRMAAAMGFYSQPAAGFEMRVNGKARLRFDVTTVDQTWQSDDENVRLAYTVMENNAEDSNGLLEIELGPALVHEDEPVTFEIVGLSGHSQRWFGLYHFPDKGG